jgi:hypothetical protein
MRGLEPRILITVIVSGGMGKKSTPPPSVPAVKRRGRSPKPGGRRPQVEIQRAYRARLAAAGKVVRIVDAGAVSPSSVSSAQAGLADFDPTKDGIRL